MHAPEILRRTRRRRNHLIPRLRVTDLRNTVWWLEALNTVLWLGVSYLVFRLAGGTFDHFGDQFAAVLAVQDVHDIPNAWLAGALTLFGIPFMIGVAALSANTGTQRRFDAWYLRRHPPAERIEQAQRTVRAILREAGPTYATRIHVLLEEGGVWGEPVFIDYVTLMSQVLRPGGRLADDLDYPTPGLPVYGLKEPTTV